MAENGRKNDKKGRMSVKYGILYVVVALWGVAILLSLCKVMFLERQFWHDVDKSLSMDERKIDARRGDILSDEGLLLASSMKQYRVFLDFGTSEKDSKRRQKDLARKDTLYEKQLDSFAQQIHDLFPQYSKQELKDYYRRGHKGRSHSWVLLPDVSRNSYPISYNKYKMLSKTEWLKPKYENWFFCAESKISRKKPFGSLASRTIGSLYEAKDSAKNGLELSFDSLLRGVPGLGHVEKVQNVTRIVPDKVQTDGCDVHTTLNVDIQDVAEVALRRQMERMEAASGIAVVMEVATGDIKAMASLNKLGDGDYQEIQNNAVRELFEPGSTFKTVSMMVALDDGRISLSDSVFCENGSYRGFDGESEMTDGMHNGIRGYGWLDVTHIIMNSCNIGVAKLINDAYGSDPKEFVEGVYDTGINTHFDLQLQGVVAPVIQKDVYWDKTRLPWMSTGYNLQLPVINTLAFYNGIANGGQMLAPRLVTEVVRDGVVEQKFPIEVVRRHMCKESTLKQIRFLLEKVVEGGTGKQAGSKYFKVAGKTGTAQISQGRSGYKNAGRSHMVSFCGYFPADAPKYSCIVAIRTSTNSKLSAGGGTMAAPVFHEISEKIMTMKSTRGMEQVADTANEHMPLVLSGNIERAGTVLHMLNGKFTEGWPRAIESDSIWGMISYDGTGYSAVSQNNPKEKVPRVIGMGAQDAVYLLEKAGLKVIINGVGKVRSQSLQPGSNFRKGDTVELKLDMR